MATNSHINYQNRSMLIKMNLQVLNFDTGYPHDSRADKDSYPHDSRATLRILIRKTGITN